MPVPVGVQPTSCPTAKEVDLMTDDLRHHLESLVPEPTEDEIERALYAVKSKDRHRRRNIWAAAAAACVVSCVIGALVVVGSDDEPDVTALGSEDPSPEANPWPWTTRPTTTSGTPATSTDLTVDEVWTAVSALAGDHTDLLQGAGRGTRSDGSPVIKVHLRADAVELAAAVWDRYSTAIEIEVGHRIFPTGAPSEYVTDCPAIEPADGVAGLEATLDLDGDGTVHSGADIDGVVRLHNTTDDDITVADPTRGDVVEAEGSDVVGVTTRGFALALSTTVVHPDETVELPVVVGTTACGPDGPPGVAPGSYEAVVVLERWTSLAAAAPAGKIAVRAPVTIIPLDVGTDTP
jgi:hypothetical protein